MKIEDLHKALSSAERVEVMRKLTDALLEFERTALALPAVRQIIYDMYNEKVQRGYSLSKFSRKFNMSLKGLNKELAEFVETTIKAAFNTPDQAFELLLSVKLAYDVLLSPSVVEQVGKVESLEIIEDCYNKLFSSVVKMCGKLGRFHAFKRSEHNLDLTHEALMAAHSGVRAYRTDDFNTPEEASKAFTTFMYYWINGTLLNLENGHRPVKLPRTILNRWAAVSAAIDQLGVVSSYEEIAKLATKILDGKRKKSRNKQLSQSEVYTADEVFRLIMISQGMTNHDRLYGGLELEIESLAPNQEVQLDMASCRNKLINLFKEYCDPDSFLLMSLRWTSGEVRGMQEVADLFEKETGVSISKSKISMIEQSLFQKLRDDPRASELMDSLL